MAPCELRDPVKPELPNLLLSTTYALNKSNSKRICVGLEYSGGYYHEVIKLVSSGGSHKSISLDRRSWDFLKDQFDAITAYFHNSYSFYQDFGRPTKLFLTNHDLNFTTSYGTKSISIDERPHPNEIHVSEEEEETPGQSLCKKRKTFNHPSGIVMQQSTFEGLRQQSVLVDLLLNDLSERVGKVNRTTDHILDFLKNKLGQEGLDNAKVILNDYKSFKQYYSILNTELEGYVTENMVDDTDHYKSLYLKFVLSEISAFSLPMIVKDLRDVMIPV